ncbi:hypothetical protein AAHA92_26453 [Salvia divinorum]|uniref:Leucine-rich repeat-containing N-terminal plant-type domain-containing protein n=1 Tax=Salvia divinorum TaxID=28513 RepID=A0ABD1GDZ9_SALDI
MLLKLLFLISALTSSFIFTAHSFHTKCLQHEKALLLQLKKELVFDSSCSTKLAQWNETAECCSWRGVGCDAAGNVASLQLDNEGISDGVGDSSALLRLKHLQKLNLAYNDFSNSPPIPRGIHSLNCLTHLNLSNAGFGGQVPAEMTSLRRLVSLDISNDYWDIEPLRLEHPSMEMLLQNMTGIRELYLDGVFLSNYERRKWSHIVSSYLSNLTGLSLVWCSLSGPLAKSFSHLSSLSVLRLDSNDLSAADLDLFANSSSLTTLSLFNSGLKGSFPSVIFQTPTLQYLDLSGNELLRPIPSTFANLTELAYVTLSYNFFTGSLSSTMFGRLLKLVRLDLVANSFSGNLPHSLFSLPSLVELYLNKNQFIGLVEEFTIVNHSNLAILDLSSNRLEGPIPDSLFQLQSLESLLFFENMFNGTFQLDKIQSFPNLTLLDLSDNNLSVVTSNTSLSSLLNELRLASCNLHDFPESIKHFDLSILDLSNNRIAGEIPSWIWGAQLQVLNLSHNLLTDLQKPYHLPVSLQLLDLQSNQLRGNLRHLIPPNIGGMRSDLQYLLLAGNDFIGSIPASLCSATKLSVLDLSVNNLSGNIPSCLLGSISTVLNLGRNNISGRIPDSFPLNCSLQIFGLNSNALEGKIPKSLESCKSLEFMNVANNNINDTFPCMLSSTLRVLTLHSNVFHGEVKCGKSWPDLQIVDVSSNSFDGSLESINLSSWRAMVGGNDAQLRYNGLASNALKVSSYYKVGVRLIMKGLSVELVKIWPDFTAIDFSCNNFRGEIPNAVGNLGSLRLLNFSHNVLNGSIPTSFGLLRQLESLDLSENKLTGEIPTELAGLTFLSVLNLSYNELVGRIPNGRQLQTFSADSFRGNAGLCGFNLNISCSRSDGSDDSDLSSRQHEEIEWEYVSTALGYVVGLGSIVWLLLFCRSFRERYFGKIDEIVEEIFDARDRRRRRARRVARNRVRRQ